MNHTSAQIIAKYLISESIFNAYNLTGDWPVFVSHLPSAIDNPQAAAITDTEGVIDGRLQSGEVIDHFGIQIRVRAETFLTGFQKIKEAAGQLETIAGTSIVIDEDNYKIHSVSRISSVLPMGVEPESRKFLFSVNFVTTLTTY